MQAIGFDKLFPRQVRSGDGVEDITDKAHALCS